MSIELFEELDGFDDRGPSKKRRHSNAPASPDNYIISSNITPDLHPGQYEQDYFVDQVIWSDTGQSVKQTSFECCYGMLCDIPLRLLPGFVHTSDRISVTLQSPKQLVSIADATTFEILCPDSARILEELEIENDFGTQLYCHQRVEPDQNKSTRRNARHQKHSSQPWLLNVIVFGNKTSMDRIGDYLLKRKKYLQDPVGCERSLPYLNPHMMSAELGNITMTDEFNRPEWSIDIERLNEGPDLLAKLMENVTELEETNAPDAVKTTLFRHQKQALTFMIRREDGWDLRNGSGDVWTHDRSLGHSRYTNNVSGHSTRDVPSDFRGGLLADDMGLGKTLSMICLIAANSARETFQHSATNSNVSRSIANIKTTLLVVPPALIQTWEAQLLLHLTPESLKHYVFHGQNKKPLESFAYYDIVITTYHTLSGLWKSHANRQEGGKSIFSLNWHRVILDEAHIIQNPQSRLAQACYALKADRRWAITGTPIQNKLSDFASIVRFLRVHPYSDHDSFVEDIIKPWKNQRGTDGTGFTRLRYLVRAITISRTKSVVSLPPRINEVHRLEFTLAERQMYDTAKTEFKAKLEEAICAGSQAKAFTLSLLNQLRLICNHGLLTHHTNKEKMSSKSQMTPLATSPLFGSRSDNTPLRSCSDCGANLMDDIFQLGIPGSSQVLQQANDFNQVLCERCMAESEDDNSNSLSVMSNWSGLNSAKSSAPTTPRPDVYFESTIDSMSTKIKALVADLHKHQRQEKSVVFSYWTNTLDFVQLMLKHEGIQFTRIDGSMNLKKRKQSLDSFQHNDVVRVILVSITCGGAGLDLTAGSRAYLLEPHWNPMIEEQALCRVHRISQTRPVTTIRYLMRDSFEVQIVEIQTRKKMLAELTFSTGAMPQVSMETLQYLKLALD